ncbi:MAG: CopD family protein [Actinomycetota bacterium]
MLTVADPGDGVSLRRPPSVISLTFTEELDPKLSSIQVRSSAGESLVGRPPEAASGDPRTLRVRVEDLDTGVYSVVWRVLSRVDGHFTAGAYAFGVGVDPSKIEEAVVATVEAPPLSPLEPTGRSLFYIGLAGTIGAVWISTFGFPNDRRRHGRVFAAAWLAAAVGFVILAMAQQRSAAAGWGAFLESSIGRAVIGRGLGLAVAAIGIAWLVRARRSSRLGALVALAAGLAAIGVHVSAGHAATGRYAWVKIATQLVHFSAAAVWIGGLGALLVGIRGEPGEVRTRAVRMFSAVAGVSLVLVAGTGTARAVAEIGSWSGLVSTGYGRLVLVKIGLVAALVALGARNRFVNVPRAAASLTGLRRTSRIELSTAAVVFVVTGVLSSLVPARSVSLAEPTASIVREATDFARTVRVRLEIVPGYPGASRFAATVDPLRGRDAVQGVRLRLSSSDADVEDVIVELERKGDVWERRSAAVAIPGNWRAVVLVERGAASVEVPIEFHTRCRTPAPTTMGPPRIYDVEVPGGSVQGYGDPGSAGRNEVHFTFFDEAGEELPMDDDPVIAAFGDRASPRLSVRRFSAGHFVAGGRLDEGVWVFEFVGSTEDGERLNVCFEDRIS